MTEAATEQTIMDYAVIARGHVLSVCTDKIVPRKTVVFTTLVDPTVIKVAGERLKRRLFTKFGIRKPSLATIQLSSLQKYYEPYIVISARYFLDYYRMCAYTVSIDSEVREFVMQNRTFYPQKSQNSTASIKFEGEERLVVEKKSFFMLLKNGQEANPETLPSAPPEKKPKDSIRVQCIKEIDPEADVDFARKRLVHRPENLSRIVDEVFEISERVVIYAPRYKLTYVNASNYEEKSIEFDGITSKRILDENLPSRAVRAIKSTLSATFKK
jgi:hypothetical protein